MVKGKFLTVKDVAEMLETEAYVLRFYEKELNLDIKRNAKGHRTYTMENVALFKQIQDMRERGLQLKAIESIVHDSKEEAKETYEQLSSIQIVPSAVVKKNEVMGVDITDVNNEKVKQFSVMMKDMLKEALVECSVHTQEEIKKEIAQKVDDAIDQKLTAIEEKQDEKNKEYYKKLDETIREVQKIRREIAEAAYDTTKQKTSFWNKLFKEKEHTKEASNHS